MTRWVAWDIEIAKPVQGNDWKAQRPLGISCAATLTDEGQSILWHAPLPPLLELDPDEFYAPQMSPAQVREMADYLWRHYQVGHHVVGFNSLSFDWDVTAQECYSDQWAARCAQMALGHIDIGFEMVCQKGYMVGLEAMGQGLKVGQKTEGMHGDLAPILWNGLSSQTTEEAKRAIESLGVELGTRAAQNLCLEYVGQDVQLTADVYRGLLEQQSLTWITKRGTRSAYPWFPKMHETPDGQPYRLYTVVECLEMPEPDTKWMTSPRPRRSYYEWTDKYRQQLELREAM